MVLTLYEIIYFKERDHVATVQVGGLLGLSVRKASSDDVRVSDSGTYISCMAASTLCVTPQTAGYIYASNISHEP